MSNIANIVGGVIALAAINRLLDTKPTAVTPTIGPLIPVTKPTPVVNTPLIKPIMPTQQEITRERITAPSGTPEQAALISKAYTQGKVIPLGFRQGETTDDLLRRLFRN